jgi:selenoprotein W-related protein
MKNEILIEYCPKCNWMLRAAWIAQELLLTFEQEIEKISLKPSLEAGVFRIFVDKIVVFDRKQFGGFAEPKIYKKLVRDVLAPDKNLGHSEK